MLGFNGLVRSRLCLKEECNNYIAGLHKPRIILSIEEDLLVRTWNIAMGTLTAKLVCNALIAEQEFDAKNCGFFLFGNAHVS